MIGEAPVSKGIHVKDEKKTTLPFVSVDRGKMLTSTISHRETKLDALGRSWTHLDAAGRNWTQLDAIGRNWTQLDASGRNWTQLDASGRKLVHFRIEKRFAETGMKKAKERGAKNAEKLDVFSVL